MRLEYLVSQIEFLKRTKKGILLKVTLYDQNGKVQKIYDQELTKGDGIKFSTVFMVNR